MREEALSFACNGDSLVGVASLPERPKALGVLVVVGGPQYRAGSHRQFVLLARRIAAAGYAVLRFDYRGMGDSAGPLHTFEQVDADLGAAIDALRTAAPAVERVVIWGLCDAASAALLYLDRRGGDPRIAGLSLLNPWVRTAATLAQTHVKHYYLQRLRQREFWLKLLRGGLAWRALRDLFDNLRQMRSRPAQAATENLPYTQRMARAWSAFGGPIQLVLSGQDFTAKEFLQTCGSDTHWQRALQRRGLQRLDLPEADHTFSDGAARRAVEDACVAWLQAIDGTALTARA